MLMFGGTNPAFLNDTWEMSLSGTPTWALIPSGGPLGREEHSMILDPARNRLVIFGGLAAGGFVGDLWSLSLSAPPPGSDHNAWQQMNPTVEAGPPPPLTWGHGAAYDPLQDRMVVHSGAAPDVENGTFFLSWSLPTATQAALVAAVGERGAARLEWELRGSAAPVRLERQDPVGWTERATLAPDGNGRIRFVDRDVTAGARYEYRLVDLGSSEILSQVTVGIPAEHLALRSANYQYGRLIIECSIPGTSELSIELLDASGRRAHQMTWTAGRAGDQRIEMRVPFLASGVYFTRIRQNGQSQTKSVAIVR
jgi:hypothetical protein